MGVLTHEKGLQKRQSPHVPNGAKGAPFVPVLQLPLHLPACYLHTLSSPFNHACSIFASWQLDWIHGLAWFCSRSHGTPANRGDKPDASAATVRRPCAMQAATAARARHGVAASPRDRISCAAGWYYGMVAATDPVFVKTRAKI